MVASWGGTFSVECRDARGVAGEPVAADVPLPSATETEG
jgi:hypothetical protein